jgi:hypothetical protein
MNLSGFANCLLCQTSANGDQLGRPDFWTSNARLGSVALLVLGLGGKGEPFYSQIAVEVPIFCMIMEAFCTLKTFGRLGPIRFAYRVETPRNQGVEAHDPGHVARHRPEPSLLG